VRFWSETTVNLNRILSTLRFLSKQRQTIQPALYRGSVICRTMPPRRSYKKSRAGGGTCKLRRVKVGEMGDAYVVFTAPLSIRIREQIAGPFPPSVMKYTQFVVVAKNVTSCAISPLKPQLLRLVLHRLFN
jgi:hypothetical protein